MEEHDAVGFGLVLRGGYEWREDEDGDDETGNLRPERGWEWDSEEHKVQ
jgi:hypothetical protein